MVSNDNFRTSSQLKKTLAASKISDSNRTQGLNEERLNPYDQAASTFMALLMIALGVIMLGEVLLFRTPGIQYSVVPAYVLVFAIVFNASNFWREKLISYKINTAVSISVNLAIVIALVHFTGGLKSEFYIAYFLIPPVAALCFGLRGTFISLAAVFISLLWFFYQEPSLTVTMRVERLLFRMLLLILVSVPFLVFVQRDKRHEEALSVSIRELEKALNELRETQSQLVQSSKLAALGQLSASIAHDLNQPLASMNLYAELASSKIENGSNLKEDIEVIQEQTGRIIKIVEGLRNFSRQSDFKLAPIEIREPIDDVLKLLAPQFRMSKIRVALNLEDDRPKIHGDKNQLQQVFLNILTNSIDALDLVNREAKSIEIDVKNISDKEFIKVMVSDNGCGISSEARDKVLKPFFTTKSSGAGVGLGLPITSTIIRQHSGFFKISSEQHDKASDQRSANLQGRTRVEMIFPSVNATPCWKMVKCLDCLGECREMCPVFQERQFYRCWEVLGEECLKERRSWPEKCKSCKMFKKMTAVLESAGMLEAQAEVNHLSRARAG